MKYFISILLFSLFCQACSDDKGEKATPTVRPEAEGTWEDPRDGSVYRWVRYGNLQWMSENMRAEPTAGDKVFYDDDERTEETFRKYGYLYDFTAANSLETDGWRLPSDDDCKELERCLGMRENETDITGWRGDFVGELMMQGHAGSGLALLCGGYAHDLGGFGTRAWGIDGIYWSSTPDETLSGCAWCRMITFNKDKIRRESMTTKRYMSVRLVKEIHK